MNSVSYILKNRPLTYDERVSIREMGRCTPDLDIKSLSGKSRQYCRYFRTVKTYDKFKWMCGCPEKKALFCFVCLLSNGIQCMSWINEGYSDLQHLHERAKRHEISALHINNLLEFTILDKVAIEKQFDREYLESIREHNENVDKNRQILRRLIMCFKYRGVFELALRGHEVHGLSKNSQILPGLVKFTSELSELTTAFKGNAKIIQNEILGIMLQVCKDEIISQISKANFLAIEAGETTDSLNQQQLVIILRYVFQGKNYERFWGFFTPEGFSPENIANVIKHELDQLEIPKEKLIAQSYDGLSTMGSNAAVPSLIRQIYPHAYCIHCYAYQLNIILEKAAYCNKELKLFFAEILAFESFFADSTKRTAVLDQTARGGFPHEPKIRWDFKAKTINTIHRAKDLIGECLEIILATENGSSETISEANSLLRILTSKDFNYFLEVTHCIAPHLETFFREVQSHGADSTEFVSNCLEKIESEITEIRDRTIDRFEMSEEIHQSEELISGKRKKIEDTNQVAAKKYCDVIIRQVCEMFDFTAHLSLAKLFSVTNMFPIPKYKFPEELFNKAMEPYESLIDKEKFKVELHVIYNRQDMTDVAVSSLLTLISRNHLEECLPETYKVLDIICTTPMTTCSREKCFSTLKKIKDFSRKTMDLDRLNALSMLSIEKELVQSIPDFDNKVINKFIGGKIQRVEFLYK